MHMCPPDAALTWRQASPWPTEPSTGQGWHQTFPFAQDLPVVITSGTWATLPSAGTRLPLLLELRGPLPVRLWAGHVPLGSRLPSGAGRGW